MQMVELNDTDKFVVADTTGNTSIAGTLGVTGATTLSSTFRCQAINRSINSFCCWNRPDTDNTSCRSGNITAGTLDATATTINRSIK